MDRRTLLAGSVLATIGLVPELHSSKHLDGEIDSQIESLRFATSRLLTLNDEEGGSARACGLSSWLLERTQMLRHSRQASPVQRSDARDLAIQISMHAGWLHFDAGHQRAARQYWQHALYEAELAEDATAQINALQSLAVQATYGLKRPPEAIDLTARADRIATGRWLSPRLHSLLTMRRANAYAELGDRREAMRAYQQADRLLEREDQQANEPDWLAFYGEHELNGLLAVAHRSLGDLDRSASFFADIGDRIPPNMKRNRLYYSTLLSRVMMERGDETQACVSLVDSIQDLVSTGSHRAREHAKAVFFATASSSSPAARNLSSAIYDLDLERALGWKSQI